MKYLLDVLQAYENDFSDILSPMRREARETFTGAHVLEGGVRTEEFRAQNHAIGERLSDVETHLHTISSSLMAVQQGHSEIRTLTASMEELKMIVLQSLSGLTSSPNFTSSMP